MSLHVAVASHSLGSGFSGHMYSQLRKHLRPGQSIVECGIVMRDDRAFQRDRLRRLLAGAPRPAALIGVCIRPEAELVAEFRDAGIPVVLIDEAVEGASTVACDNAAGGYLGAKHLLDSGRSSIGVITGQLAVNGGYNAVQRIRGMEKALAERGLTFAREEIVQVIDYSRREGAAALSELLARRSRLDAVFCAAGDVCATGVLACARERKLAVPEALAVLGFDDNPLAAISNPPLSTVRQPLAEISGAAWRLATEEADEILARPQQILLEPVLVERASTRVAAAHPESLRGRTQVPRAGVAG
jgi:DNA-binding LacI/PurR family transcriptional regulator